MKISEDKEIIIKRLLNWYKNKKIQYVTLGGYAGTGKTTLISFYRAALKKEYPKLKVAFVSYTGKATRVLLEKLKTNNTLQSKDTISTIHSLIYSPIINKNEEITGWQLKDELKVDLIIIDEASMVDAQIWSDLKSYRVPILAVGDHGQLPPIGNSFSLMDKPMLILDKIHRQAQDNPIIKLSIQVRKYGLIPFGSFSETVKKFDKRDSDNQDILNDLLASYDQDTLVLCGYNSTRTKLNNHIRANIGFETPLPTRGDRVICLRNNHAKSIYNGMLGYIESIEISDDKDWYLSEISFDNEQDTYKGLISTKQFNQTTSANYTDKRKYVKKGDLFDFGYALTVHKAQGSEARKVILFEERFKQMDDDMWRRWLYTAVTRSSEELYIFG